MSLKSEYEHYKEESLTNDLTVLVAGVVTASTPWWWNYFDIIPEGLKFLGLVATVIYLIFRAVNEVGKFLKDRRPL